MAFTSVHFENVANTSVVKAAIILYQTPHHQTKKMLITKKQESFIKTFSGQSHEIKKYSLYFRDKSLESEYVAYLTKNSFSLFQKTSIWIMIFIIIYWIYCVAILSVYNGILFLLPICTLIYGVATLGLGHHLVKTKRYRPYLEYLYGLSHFIYVAGTLEILSVLVHDKTNADYQYLKTLPVNYVSALDLAI